MSYHSGNEMIDAALLYEKMHLRDGMRVADLGSGRTGHLVFPAAKIVGENGAVYAVDILKDVLDVISRRAKMEGLPMVRTIWGDIEEVGGVAIPAESLDGIFIMNVLCRIPRDKHMSVMDEAARLLKPKARLVIVDWSESKLSIAPPKSSLLDFADCTTLAQAHGFVPQETFHAGPHHVGLVLYRAV
jgi:ubiquinone/menaquinone biosynthesis C-methylase UbiE